MDEKLINENEKNIIELLASNEPANDLIALEIIKHAKDLQPHLGKLLAILSNAKDDDEWIYRYSFIKPLINIQTRQYLENHRRHSGKYKLYAANFFHYCGQQVSVDMAYIQFRQDPSEAAIFLQLDQGNHPKRKEIFQSFLKQISPKEILQRLVIPGLNFDELELLLEKVFNLTNKDQFPKLSFLSYKSKAVPSILFNKKYTNVHIEFTYTNRFFPSFLFQLKGVENLILPFYKGWKLPTDWRNLEDLKVIDFYGADQGFDFENLDFIDTLPLLERLHLSLHFLSEPTILIRKRLPDIRGFQFKKDLGFPMKLPAKDILKIAEALGNSDLDKQQKKFYFKKFLHLKRLEDAQWFPLNDLKTLINVPHLGLQRSLKIRLKQLGIKVLEKEIEIHSKEDENLYQLVYSKDPHNNTLAFEIIKNKENAKQYLSTLLFLLSTSEKLEDAEHRFKFIASFLTKIQRKYLGSKIQFLKGKHYQIYNLQKYLDRKTSIGYAYISFRKTGQLPLLFTLE